MGQTKSTCGFPSSTSSIQNERWPEYHRNDMDEFWWNDNGDHNHHGTHIEKWLKRILKDQEQTLWIRTFSQLMIFQYSPIILRTPFNNSKHDCSEAFLSFFHFQLILPLYFPLRKNMDPPPLFFFETVTDGLIVCGLDDKLDLPLSRNLPSPKYLNPLFRN